VEAIGAESVARYFKAMQVLLTGKAAIVTGAASGIGLATVLEFLESAVKGIVAVDIAAKPPEEFAAAIRSGKVVYLAGDVGKGETAERFAKAAVESFGRIDILVNNAGTSVVKAIHEHTPEEWDAVMDTNVKAAYWSAKHVIPVMIKQGSGVVLNTGSISGLAGIPMQGAYGPSKGAIHQLTRQMAIEYAPHGIRVNAIGCGTVDTPIVHRSAVASGDAEGFWAMLRDNHPIGRIASPKEVAAFFTYMTSDLASFFTGSIIMMDGGYTAK
jgi:NAD(P)-dependent dehydrogenase (short-subunit alcohol dehydrogenase family)